MKRTKYPNAWTPEEDQLIVDNWRSVTGQEMAALLPGRTLAATRRRVLILRDKGYNVGSKRIAFTNEENEFIRKNAKVLTIYQISQQLRRHPSTVAVQATRIRISLRKTGDLNNLTKYTDEDVVLICALRDDGMSFAEIARKFELRTYTVRDIYNHRKIATDCLSN